MTTDLLLMSISLLAFVAVLNYPLRAAAKNTLTIGVRAYPRMEHRRRYEQWMLLPQLGLVTSVAAGLATGLVFTGGPNIGLGFLILSVSSLLLLYFGLFLGIVRRESPSTWGPDASLEAINGEVMADQGSDKLPRTLLESWYASLQSKGAELERRKALRRSGQAIDGLTWTDRPWAGIGILRRDENHVVRVPFTNVITFMRSQVWLLLPSAISAVSALVLLGHSDRSPLMVAAVPTLILVLGVTMYTGARSELIYRRRSLLEEAELIAGTLRAVERRLDRIRNSRTLASVLWGALLEYFSTTREGSTSVQGDS